MIELPNRRDYIAGCYDTPERIMEQTLKGLVGPEPGNSGEFKYACNTDSHIPEDPKRLGTLTDHLNTFFVDIGLEVLEECKPAHSPLGNVISGPEKLPVVKFRHPDISPSLVQRLKDVSLERLKELGTFNEEILWFFQQIPKKDFRMVIEQILWEDELAELEGREALFAEIRKIKADTEARRKIVMDRMRQGGRVVARGDSLDEVMRKVRAQQKPDTL